MHKIVCPSNIGIEDGSLTDMETQQEFITATNGKPTQRSHIICSEDKRPHASMYDERVGVCHKPQMNCLIYKTSSSRPYSHS